MTYDAIEKSAYNGTPVELYKFTMGPYAWHYTDSDADVVDGADTYLAQFPISRTEPEISKETQKSDLTITTCKDFPIVQLFMSNNPPNKLWVTVFRMHSGDSAHEKLVLWQGKIRGVKYLPAGGVEITANPIEKIISKAGFRQTFSPYCFKDLYSDRCGLSSAIYAVPFTVTAISPDRCFITSPDFATKPANYFRLGELNIPRLFVHSMVLKHLAISLDTVQLSVPISGLIVGDVGTALAGCDHVWRSKATADVITAAIEGGATVAEANLANPPDGDCNIKFNNLANFGGFPFAPIKNPYEVSLKG